ncbi:MAG TPA: HAD-IA family hydrolase, partial [Thermoanaerobaculia bacterium]|nr:HAD-IA family hydrolase [Thermoanaerobaculia bacterium]
LRPHAFGPLEREFDLGRLSPGEFFRAVERSAGLPRIPDAVWTPAWRDIFEPDLHALEALGRLRTGVRKILVSNTNALHWEGVRRVVDVAALVDDLVLSFEIGAAKPERAIFDAALGRAAVPPAAALFVDDRPTYVSAARTLGIPAFAATGPGAFERGLLRAGLLEPL